MYGGGGLYLNLRGPLFSYFLLFYLFVWLCYLENKEKEINKRLSEYIGSDKNRKKAEGKVEGFLITEN